MKREFREPKPPYTRYVLKDVPEDLDGAEATIIESAYDYNADKREHVINNNKDEGNEVSDHWFVRLDSTGLKVMIDERAIVKQDAGSNFRLAATTTTSAKANAKS